MEYLGQAEHGKALRGAHLESGKLPERQPWQLPNDQPLACVEVEVKDFIVPRTASGRAQIQKNAEVCCVDSKSLHLWLIKMGATIPDSDLVTLGVAQIEFINIYNYRRLQG